MTLYKAGEGVTPSPGYLYKLSIGYNNDTHNILLYAIEANRFKLVETGAILPLYDEGICKWMREAKLSETDLDYLKMRNYSLQGTMVYVKENEEDDGFDFWLDYSKIS